MRCLKPVTFAAAAMLTAGLSLAAAAADDPPADVPKAKAEFRPADPAEEEGLDVDLVLLDHAAVRKDLSLEGRELQAVKEMLAEMHASLDQSARSHGRYLIQSKIVPGYNIPPKFSGALAGADPKPLTMTKVPAPDEIRAEYQARARKLLTPDQWRRLVQLTAQWHGVGVLAKPAYARAVFLTPEEGKAIAHRFEADLSKALYPDVDGVDALMRAYQDREKNIALAREKAHRELEKIIVRGQGSLMRLGQRFSPHSAMGRWMILQGAPLDWDPKEPRPAVTGHGIPGISPTAGPGCFERDKPPTTEELLELPFKAKN
jgi:hypothetical protein